VTVFSGIGVFLTESKTAMAAFDAAVKLVVGELHNPDHWSGNITSAVLEAARVIAAVNETDKY